jgi:hypothetical protein
MGINGYVWLTRDLLPRDAQFIVLLRNATPELLAVLETADPYIRRYGSNEEIAILDALDGRVGK